MPHSKLLETIQSGFTTEEGLALAKRTLALKEALTQVGFLKKRFVILPGYSTQFLTKLFELSLLREKISASTFELEYGVFETAVRSKDARIKNFSPELCYFCVGTENFQFRKAKEEAARWLELCKLAHEWLGSSILINTFTEPVLRTNGSFDFKSDSSELNFVRDVNSILRREAPSYVHFFDIASLASFHGIKNWHDEKMYDLYKLPCAFAHLSTYAEQLARVCARVFAGAKKCLILDLDNTLWGGVIGDDGISGIHIGEGTPTGEAYKRFQTYLKTLKEQGTLLTVCSKNDLKNAEAPFRHREEMVLKLEDISCFIANWEPKSQGIKQIAKSLNIGLDSMVFVDDNPAERKLVRMELPEVSVLELPEDPSYYARTLSEAKYFETISITEEDRTKTQMIQAETNREKAKSNASNYAEYLRSLEMKARIQKFDDLHLPRIVQLINKTNQFNVTTKRYTESEVSGFIDNPKYLSRFVKLSDQYGDHGLISAFVGVIENKELYIDTWVMSCRVFQREVESLLFREVLHEAQRQKLTAIRATFLPTEKNAVIKDLFSTLGFRNTKKNPNGSTEWALSLSESDLSSAWNSKQIPITYV